jgi:hypothetical protein
MIFLLIGLPCAALAIYVLRYALIERRTGRATPALDGITGVPGFNRASSPKLFKARQLTVWLNFALFAFLER